MTKVKLDKERNLHRGLKGLKLFEDKTGKSFLKGLDTEQLSMGDLQILLWALLIDEDKNLTLEKVEEIIEHVDALEILEAIGKELGRKG